MSEYYLFLVLLSTHQPCTKFHLEHLQRGQHIGALEKCIQLGYACECGTNANGDKLYGITSSGLEIVNH